MGPVYEQMCFEKIARDGGAILGFEPARIGRYWGHRSEIDPIVEDAMRERVAFIECRWSRKVDVDSVLSHLSRKADLVMEYAGVSGSLYVMSRTETDHPNHIRLG